MFKFLVGTLLILALAVNVTAGSVHPFIKPDTSYVSAPVAVPEPQPARKKKKDYAYWASVGAVGASIAVDGTVTQQNVDRGISREGNGVLAKSDGSLNWPVFIGISASATIANHFLLYRRGHTKAAIVVNCVITALHISAAIYGISQRR